MSAVDSRASGGDRERAIAVFLNRIADAIDPDLLGAQIGDAIFDRVGEFGQRDDDLRSLTETVAIRTVHDVWHGVRLSAERVDLDPPPAAVGWPAELVRRGVELHAMLRAYRVGHDLVERAWETAAAQIEADGDVRADALKHASRFFFSYVDAVSVQLTQIYLEESARHARGAAAVREEMLKALLSGKKVPPARATAGLRYEVSGTHVGFIVWMEPAEPDDRHAAALETVAARIGVAIGDGEYMLVPVGNWVVWGWARLFAPRSTRRRPALSVPDVVRVAVGGAAAGMEGLVQTHQEAAAARRVARLPGQGTHRVVFHRDVALLDLLTMNPLAAERFVRTELGQLATEDEQMARLRMTLQVYFEENLSPIRTARRLGVNKNTVVYRMERVEEILGHVVLERRRELEAALQLAHVYLDSGA
ncbi:hypothetical protein FOS14_10640 [Skermania sp. ID1734]|uniref:PucR family transcriptional regulator n=1 Tax=Skermania sp. ID1734 TaxID=2597516 RepID=UPI0011803BBF|nr:PucR family transcriptional regulator [Skermania sp. ID1734]TSD99718.1 hypothetical protein FOS14_10640 [Skermania sp. ID1734]